MKSLTKLEAILWSIALPGFSQLLSGQLFKGTLFVLLEIVINVYSNFNLAIIYSFMGEINQAIEITNFQWLMFYPCLYMFAMWDSYRTAMDEKEELSFLPFVFSAYFITVGLMYSTKVTIFGILIGPVFFPMLFLIPGLFVGFLLRWLILSILKQRTI
ncbi:hypothetical protein F7731_06630 [Cytobacillus depressus]|uniref:Uncharacterized protein n=1 Tax=Cytobacillus depressus TaxID=1602942 RepID=A0A6L3VB23_9BACI|nr:hypothetical protein [Cytobacillus depressus]KAB2337723.1 hypothetical protein F7731_06630 [Cytobacillus depressus]